MRPFTTLQRFVLALLLLPVLWTQQASAQVLPTIELPAASLDRTTVPAAGKQRAVLTVRRFGRYAVTISSEQGVALQLVDRMAGPGSVSGRAGHEDGRLDVFLDYGEYQILTLGHGGASGEAMLEVRAFDEIHPHPAPRLVDLKPVDQELGDFEQRSYWLLIEKRRWVQLEAAGRALRDLRLWRDGNWLIDAAPRTEVLTPRAGQPLFACRLAVQLEPGLYLLTAYGGRAQPWAEGDGESPFHLRMGIPALATAGRARFEVGPLGIDRWRVPSRANFYRLELPESRLAVLRVGKFSEASPFAATGTAARIEKTSELPLTETFVDIDDEGYDIVTIEAEAGQPYVLQHFETRHRFSLEGSGDYWLSTVHSGHPEDSIEATAVLAEWDHRSKIQPRPLREQTVIVGARKGWAGRANLIEPLTVHVKVERTGSYVVESSETEARFLFEPFHVYRPSGYQAPPARGSGAVWDLEAGFYVLTVTPVQKGIVAMTIRPNGLVDNLLGLVGLEADTRAPLRGAVRFPSVSLRKRHRYRLFLNLQPEVSSGMILRRLPMRLSDPLPLTLRPGEEVAIPFYTPETVRLGGTTEDGSTLAISVDQGPWRGSHEVGRGKHIAVVRHPSEGRVFASVGTTPVRLLATAPLPPLPEGALDALPDFPTLTVAEPLFFGLERSRPKVFLVRPEDDALYRLETTGLLDTEGRVRSRVVTELARSNSGGSGRNFFLHSYLGAGDYQLVLAARGRSQGDLGLALTRSEPLDGGELGAGLPARIELAAGEAVVYTFRIAEAGQYRLRSLALGRTPRCRLEDGDRWPLVAPGGPADFDRHFEVGEYRLLLLPESVPGRRLTLLERVVAPPDLVGHGPHTLPLDTTVRHRWLEPEGTARREPDSWRFELPGPSHVAIRLTSEMHGRVFRQSDGVEVAYVPPARGRALDLAAGAYRFEVECLRRNNRVDYEIEVRPDALLAGAQRQVTAPDTIPVAVGDGALVEITSFGVTDVRARLQDATGREVAWNDDRAGDWNFHLASYLEPGVYSLSVDPVGASSASTSIRMGAREEVAHPPMTAPASTTLELADGVHTLPLELPESELLLVSARSAENIGLVVEARQPDGSWAAVASRVDPRARIELPIMTTGRYRLRLWSADRRGHPVRLAIAAVVPRHVTEAELAHGVKLRSVDGLAADDAIAVAAVDLPRSGIFRSAPGLEMRWSGKMGSPLASPSSGWLIAPHRTAWLAVPTSDRSVRVRSQRAVIESGEQAGMQLPMARGQSVQVDLAGEKGGTEGTPLLVLARSATSQPGLRIVNSGVEGPFDLSSTAVAAGASAAVALGGPSARAQVWLAENVASAADVRLTTLAFEASPPLEALAFGRSSGELAAEARSFELPPGRHRMHLVLTPGIVAVLTREGAVESVHWNGGRSLTERLVTHGDRLLLLHTRDEVDRYAIDLLPAAAGEQVLSAGSPVEIVAPTVGSLRIRVEPGGDSERTLFTYGARVAVFQSDQGEVRRGQRMRVGAAGGLVTVGHDPGLVALWIGPEGKAEEGFWAGVEPPPAVPVTMPLRWRLDGPQAALAFDPQQSVLLSVSGASRAAYRLTTASGSRSWISPGGDLHHAFLAAGPAALTVRGLAGQTLTGELEVLGLPVTEIGEGLGPEILLAPGDARAFRFTLDHSGAVGVGVWADSDTVECELLDEQGRRLGSGVVQMHDLEAGDYWIVVRLNRAGTAVRARPAVVGVDQPPSGPPEEDIRRYLRLQTAVGR